MKRLIDADAVIESMTKFSNATGEDMTHGIFYAHIAPTIDAEPVRHGKWIPHEDEDGEHYGDKCSECGEWYVMPYGKTNFCPHCGARMDEE